jgi:hypothetical protein
MKFSPWGYLFYCALVCLFATLINEAHRNPSDGRGGSGGSGRSWGSGSAWNSGNGGHSSGGSWAGGGGGHK